MPFPNEHAARIKDPNLFKKGSFRSKKIKSGIRIIIGRLKKPPKGQEGSAVTQAYRFDKDKFTVAEAKAWLKKNDISFILFEPASEAGSTKRKLSLERPDVVEQIGTKLQKLIKDKKRYSH